MKPKVIYQIYLRNFTVEGTLKGAEKMLQHISNLGVDMIYLSALNSADDAKEGQSRRQIASGMNNPKNPYRIVDYFNVDEEYGTIEDLKDFVNTAHRYDLKVIIDLVYLHCGVNAVFLKENPDFVIRNEDGTIKVGEGWPFARLNYDNPKLREYLWSNMEFYIRNINADGFRCDVGDQVPLEFWAEGIKRVKRIKPDLFMLNEGHKDELLEVFDANYCYNLIGKTYAYEKNSGKQTTHIIAEDDKSDYTAKYFKDKWNELQKPIHLGRVLNYWENHDTASDAYEDRLEKVIGNDGADSILALVFTLYGIPMIYNGNEVADNSLKNMFWNRFCSGNMSVQWENLATEAGQKRMQLIKKLIMIRKRYKAIPDGELVWINHTNVDNVLAFSRIYNDEKVDVIINVTSKIQNTSVDSISQDILISQNADISDDMVTLLPYGYVICK